MGVLFVYEIKAWCLIWKGTKKWKFRSPGLERQLNTLLETKMRDLKSHHLSKIDNDINDYLLGILWIQREYMIKIVILSLPSFLFRIITETLLKVNCLNAAWLYQKKSLFFSDWNIFEMPSFLRELGSPVTSYGSGWYQSSGKLQEDANKSERVFSD